MEPTSWRDVFYRSEQCIPSWKLRKSIEFLRLARVPGAGWGEYPRVPPALHATSLAILALAESGSGETEGIVGGAAAFAREQYGRDIATLHLDDLCDLLSVCAIERRPEDRLSDSVFVEIARQFETLVSHSQLTLRKITTIIVALDLSQRLAGFSRLDELAVNLSKMQNADGGFSPVPGGPSAVLSSAIGMRALSRIDGAAESYVRAQAYLSRGLDRDGWSSLSDVFAHATVLWAVAEAPSYDYQIVKNGIELLFQKMNVDGSWGLSLGVTGDVEHSALSLRALAAAGEHRFVPIRLALSGLNTLQSELAQARAERNTLRESIERRVQEDCGQVVRERNELLTRNKKLVRDSEEEREAARIARNSVEALELRLRLAERELELFQRSYISSYSRSSLRILDAALELTMFALMAGLVVAAIASAWTLAQARWQIPKVWLVSGTVVAGTLATVSAWTLRHAIRSFVRLLLPWRRLDDLERLRHLSLSLPGDLLSPMHDIPGDMISNLRRMYIDMTEDWPLDVRDELGYRLARDLVEMPPEIGIRYADDLRLKLHIPSQAGSQLSAWLNYFMRLNPSARRVLVEQITRGSLR